MSVRCCAVEGGAVVTCVDDQKIVEADTAEAEAEFMWAVKNGSMKEVPVMKSQRPTLICCYFYRRVCTNTHSYPLVSTSSSSIHVKI